MASQDCLASFGVEIDEAGVTRLQNIPEENRTLAGELAAAFDAASSSISAFPDLGLLNLSGSRIAEERQLRKKAPDRIRDRTATNVMICTLPAATITAVKKAGGSYAIPPPYSFHSTGKHTSVTNSSGSCV